MFQPSWVITGLMEICKVIILVCHYVYHGMG